MGHAFISYARADAAEVDRLQGKLEAAGVQVWRDTKDLGPGEDWRSGIRRAITDNAMVFIACFSSQSAERPASYQREELQLAIDVLRMRSPDDRWFIPVRLDDCAIPDYRIGGDRTLRSIQRIDLFGERSEQAAEHLVSAVRKQLGPAVRPQARFTGESGFLTGQELIAYIFAPVDGPSAEDAQAGIRHVWSQCRAVLGMTGSMRQPEIPASLPADFSATPDPAALAGQQSPDTSRQAVLQRSHDTLILLIRLAVTAGMEQPWPALDQLLRAAAGDLDRHLPGAAVLYLATLAGPGYLPKDQHTGTGTPQLASAISGLLPATCGAGAWRPGGLGGRLAVWEIPAGDEASTTRRFVMVAPPGAGAEISGWTWPSGDASMPPLARYLMHTAKIRYEARMLSGLPPAGPLCQRVADTIASLRTFTNSKATPVAEHTTGRPVVSRQLAGLRRDDIQLTSLLEALTAMRLTVAISQASAAHALAATSPGTTEPGRSTPGFPGDDQAIAGSLVQRLNDDIAHLEESLASARNVAEGVRATTGPLRRESLVPANAAIGPHPARAVVLCALNLEHAAMRAHLGSLRGQQHSAGTLFEIGHLPGTDWEVVLALPGMGNLGAAVIAERAISLFGPSVMLCVGVAGSLKDKVRIGDVVVATRVDAYHGGRAAEDFLARPRTWPASHRLEQLAQHLDRTGEWRQRLPVSEREPPPAVHFRPIASGEVVLDSRKSALFAQLRLHNNDAAAIEMEGAGIAQAAHFNDSLDALVVRGISDLADGSKPAADQANWQERAARRAAAFAAGLLASYVPQPAS